MVDFRKAILLLAVMVVATGIASAQIFNPLSCVANAGVPPLLRSEGVAEEVGQVTINCQGGNPTAAGQPIQTVNVIIFLSTNLTSRLLPSGSASPTGSEALLLIDEPGSLANSVDQLLCAAPGNCAMTSLSGTGGRDSYNGSAGRYNVFQAIKNAENSVAWLGVPVDPPGSQNNRVLRLTNVRANASIVPGVGVGLVPPAVTMTISITGTGSLTLTNPVQTVGFVTPGLIQGKGTVVDLKQCETDNPVFTVQAVEGFANAFRARPENILSVPQRNPGTIYNTESMFTPANAGPTFLLPNAGVATQATRLGFRFTNIPVGIGLSVPNSVLSGTDQWCIVSGANSSGAGGAASCVGSTSVLSTTAATRSTGVFYELVGNSSQVAVLNTVSLPVTVSRSVSPLPSLGSGSYSVSFAPLSGSPFMSSTEMAPRFVETGSQAVGLNVTACRTNLLWPYVTAAAGFDTGLAISNTSLDPFGTQTQTGACRLSYYGPMANLPSKKSIGEIKPGEYKAWLVSTGGVGDLTGTPGFTGYVIAQCDFQFAHGYAFITNPGETRWAQGYLALVLDADMFGTSWAYDGEGGVIFSKGDPLTRTGDRSETLKH